MINSNKLVFHVLIRNGKQTQVWIPSSITSDHIYFMQKSILGGHSLRFYIVFLNLQYVLNIVFS